MSLEVDFGIGEHGALVVTDGHAGAVIAHLPQGARIGLNEALIIQAEWDAVRNNRDNTPSRDAQTIPTPMGYNAG